MSKRNDLSALFKGYKEKYDSLQAAIKEVRSSTLLTDEGKGQEIQRLKAEFAPTVQNYHDAAISIIDEESTNLSAKWSAAVISKLSDGNYQAGLSNVLKMIETGSITRKEDMQVIIDTYKEDPMAMSSIRNMLTENSKPDVEHKYNSFNSETAVSFADMIPRDSRERNTQLIQQLRGNVDKYINVENIGAEEKQWNSFNAIDPSISMNGMSEFVDTKLTDDFTLVE